MSAEHAEQLDPQMKSALDELQRTITQRFPSARFAIRRDVEEPENVDLVTTVDLEDPDEVLDLVLEQLMHWQVGERIPVHVIPIRTPERTAADLHIAPQPVHRLHRRVSALPLSLPTA